MFTISSARQRSNAGIGTFAKGANRQVLERYDAVQETIQYGAATWKSVGDLLVRVCEEYQQAGRHETDIRIISDFITELRQRELMPKPAWDWLPTLRGQPTVGGAIRIVCQDSVRRCGL